jgi:hydrogenase-4 component F
MTALSAILILLEALPLVLTLLSLQTATPRLAGAATAVGALTTFGLCIVMAATVANGPHVVTALGGLFRLDALGAVFLVTVGLVYGLTALYTVGYLRPDEALPDFPAFNRNFLGLLNLFGWSMLLVPVLNNLAGLWIAVELTTIFSALLVALEGTDTSLEAAWKYIIVASAGLALALLGIVLLYAAGVPRLGTSYLPDWTTMMAAGSHLDHRLVQLAFVVSLIGFGTKVGIVPLHTWLPDAHSEGPTPVSAMLSGALLVDALYAVFRLYAIAQHAGAGAPARDLLLGFGILTLVVAAFFVLQQRNYKRLLAYSSVENMGLLTVATAFGGPIALYGMLLHVLNHAATKSMVFFGAGSVLRRYETKQIDQVSGVIGVMPYTGPLLLIGILALGGMPPFSMFRSELLMLTGGFERQQYGAAAVFLAFVTLLFMGLLFHFSRMIWHPAPAAVPHGDTHPLMIAAMVLDCILVVGLGLGIPPPLHHLLLQAAGILGGRP